MSTALTHYVPLWHKGGEWESFFTSYPTSMHNLYNFLTCLYPNFTIFDSISISIATPKSVHFSEYMCIDLISSKVKGILYSTSTVLVPVPIEQPPLPAQLICVLPHGGNYYAYVCVSLFSSRQYLYI